MSPPDDSLRSVLAREALANIPTILTLMDRNRHSPTFGSFDRNYWHYAFIDFPSGMAQEYVLPLALAYSLDIPGNPYFRCETVRAWVEAGIRYAARSAHGDGSCDHFFFYERAAGAVAFTLMACTEAARLIDLDSEDVRRFLALRADWLAGHHESGTLTNHKALSALGLTLAGRFLETDRWTTHVEDNIRTALAWQDEEGWFQEYEGCDPGYLTLTVTALAWLHTLTPRDDLKAALERAVRFAARFVHPDGSYGGEYGSRSTYGYFPLGFELVGRWMPEALAVNDAVLTGLSQGKGPAHTDDRIIGHDTWNRLMAWRDWVPDRPSAPLDRPEGRFAVIRDPGGAIFGLFEGDVDD